VQVSSQKKYFVDQHARTASHIAKREKMRVNCQEGVLARWSLSVNVPSTSIKSEKDAVDAIDVTRAVSVLRKSNFDIGGEYQWQKIRYLCSVSSANNLKKYAICQNYFFN
jgi:hypothetical protein